jgi:hypothetical protein
MRPRISPGSSAHWLLVAGSTPRSAAKVLGTRQAS